MKFKKEFEVYYVNCQNDNQSRFVPLIENMLETSIAHDKQAMKNYSSEVNFFWVLYNWNIEVFEMPKAEDHLMITTYESHVERFFAYRNFEVFCGEKCMVKAMTKWVLLNKETLSPMHIPHELQELYGIVPDDYSKKDYRLSKNKREYVATFRVRKADIDVNQHVNNVRYMDWALEGMKDAECIRNFQIVYKKQTYFGETVDLYTYETGNTTEFEIRVGKETRAYGLVTK